MDETHGREPELRSDPPDAGALADLFLRPSRFFGRVALDRPAWYRSILLAWGVVETSGQIDQNVMRAELGAPRPGWEQLGPVLLDSWLSFWLFVLVVGCAAAAFHWYVGGWWYRVRLRFSGAADPDRREARLVMTWAGLVMALPTLLGLVIATAVFDSYGAYWASEEFVSALLLLFPFWSVVASYKGVRSRFDVSPWRSRIWFLILPLLVFSIGFFALGLAYTLGG